MQGITEKQMDGYKRIRIGTADKKATNIFIIVAVPMLILLAIWVYREIPPSLWRPAYFLAIYTGAAIFYLNFGVWFHEQLHCLAFRGTIHEKNTKIVFTRKFILALSGYYSVIGDIDYRTMKRALLSPLMLVAGFLLIGCIGSPRVSHLTQNCTISRVKCVNLGH